MMFNEKAPAWEASFSLLLSRVCFVLARWRVYLNLAAVPRTFTQLTQTLRTLHYYQHEHHEHHDGLGEAELSGQSAAARSLRVQDQADRAKQF